MKKKLTLKDIAELAGVSKTTASMCLNGKAKQYNISETTQKRIAKIVKEHNYTPNLHARAMLSKRTYLIGVVLAGDINQSFWVDILQGIENAVSKEGYHIVLSLSHLDATQELESLEFIRSKGVDGLIYAPVKSRGSSDFTFIKELTQELPIVSLTCKTEDLPSVYMDNKTGGALAAEHLYNNGHRKIAYIGSSLPLDNRRESFINYLEEKQVIVDEFTSVEEFIKESSNYTAVFCFADHIVMELYKHLPSAGIKVPNDLSVIGYDNLDMLNYLSPKPATINQFKKELGTAAAESLLAQINDPKSSTEDKIFTPELIENHSIKTIS